jgi:RNA recognition motif-containing protein
MEVIITYLIIYTMNIYVGNLDFKVNENDLEEVFEEYGTVSSSRIITDKYSGRSKGFGFVTMENLDEANKAIHELNGANYENRNMVVNEAKPRKNDVNNF